MIKKNQRLLNAINMITDAVIVLLAYLFASWFWLQVFQKDLTNIARLNLFWSGAFWASIIYAAAMALILAMLGIYKSSRVRGLKREFFIILEANILGILGVGAALYLFRLQEFSRGVLSTFFIASIGALCVKRLLMRYILRGMRRRGYNQKHVVVVGTGSLARQYASSIAKHPSFGFMITGFVGKVSEGEEKLHILGGFNVLEDLLRTPDIDEVIIALEPHEAQHTTSVIEICEKNGTKVGIVPFYNDIIPANPTIEIIGDTKIFNLRSNPLDNIGLAFVKRGFDILVSAILLVILSPLMLAAAIGIRYSSPGPILFKQKRVGLNKRDFTMLKFRSMRMNTQEDHGWTTSDDPRRTRFGSFLRKFSIDELPQLVNVLRGDMSLIGPRPEVPHFVEEFRESIPLYMVKHQVRPGLTGWAQVNGYRGDTSIEERIRHDIWYIENWSFGLDLKIMFRSIFGAWVNDEKLPKV